MGNDAEPNWRSLRYPRSESDWLIHAAVSLLMALAFAQLLVWGLEAEAPSAITRRTLHKVLSELPDDPAPPTLRKKLDGHVVCLVGRLKGGQIHDKQTGFAWQGLRLQRNREVLTGGCKSSTQTGSAQARTTCSAGARHTVTDLDLTAPAPMLGDFKLSGSLVKQMQLRPLTKGLPDTLTVTDARDGQTVYTRDKAGHKFGGAGQGKVWFEGVGRVNVTLVAMQMKDTLVPFRFPKGVEGVFRVRGSAPGLEVGGFPPHRHMKCRFSGGRPSSTTATILGTQGRVLPEAKAICKANRQEP